MIQLLVMGYSEKMLNLLYIHMKFIDMQFFFLVLYPQIISLAILTDDPFCTV